MSASNIYFYPICCVAFCYFYLIQYAISDLYLFLNSYNYTHPHIIIFTINKKLGDISSFIKSIEQAIAHVRVTYYKYDIRSISDSVKCFRLITKVVPPGVSSTSLFRKHWIATFSVFLPYDFLKFQMTDYRNDFYPSFKFDVSLSLSKHTTYFAIFFCS